MIVGPRRTGKTQMSLLIAERLCEAWLASLSEDQRRQDAGNRMTPVVYLRTMDLFMRLKATFGEGAGESERSVVAELEKPLLLVIDEIQDRGQTPWEDRMLALIIDRRYAAMRDTLLIGNLRPEVLRDHVGDSIYSRAAETGDVIAATWPPFSGRVDSGGDR